MANLDEVENMIVQVGLGSRSAFSSLYDATSARLFGVCLRVLNNRAEAEDTLQEVFERVWHKAGLFSQTGNSPMTWLITLARNAAIDRLRARKRVTVNVDEANELFDNAPSPEEETEASIEKIRLQKCLEELETKRADAVRMAYLEGYSYKDLALRYDIPLNTVRTWLRRSLLKLKDCLVR